MKQIIYWPTLIAAFAMALHSCLPVPERDITQFQQFLNQQGYPVKIDGKLTVSGHGETETAWNEFIKNGGK